MNPAENAGEVSSDEITPAHLAAEAAIPLAGAIVADVLGRSVRRVTPLVGWGAVNLIFFVETGEGEVVVRLNMPEDNPAKIRGDYEKERWCIERATAAGIPGPEVLALGEHSGRAFMLQNRIPGINGKQSQMPGADLMRVLGGYARRIHAIPADGFGENLSGFESGTAKEGWHRFVDYNLGELTVRDPLLTLNVYTPDQQEAIREAFTWLRGLPLRVGLNHGDLARRNTIVTESGTVYLLDWGSAEMHIIPHYDLRALIHWYGLDHVNLRAFREGYGISDAEWATLVPELTAFSLLKAFDLTRWAIDRCPDRIPEITESTRHCLRAWRDAGSPRNS